MKRIVILGGGTSGTLAANQLCHSIPDTQITVVDRGDARVCRPGLLFVPFGLADVGEITRPRLLAAGVGFRKAGIGRVDLGSQTVVLNDGAALGYDVLVIASGAQLLPDETEGLTGEGWQDRVFTFYTPSGAAALRDALARFGGGRLAVNIVDMPITCPGAPLEFCFLADWYFRERTIRDRVEITYVTPLDGAAIRPAASAELAGRLRARGISVVTGFHTGAVDAAGRPGRLVSWDGRQVAFDLAVVVPLHGGADYVTRSEGLGDQLGFVPVNEHTTQSVAAPNVFAIGAATGVTASSAGPGTQITAEVLAENIRGFLAAQPLAAGAGHAGAGLRRHQVC